MLQNDARIENINGLKFYEQDIIYDNHEYIGDIEITIKLDYITPGFGIALLNSEGSPLEEQNEIYLFKLGNRENSVIYKNGIKQKTVKRAASSFAPPYNNLTLVFSKKGKNIRLDSPDIDMPFIDYAIPSDNWDQYSIGIYSNKGNVVKTISVATSIPDKWFVNMYNTNGGYVKFLPSGFELIGCRENAEVEQNKISLKAGTYYLKYDTAGKENDITPYIIPSNSTEISLSQKNILKDKSFILYEDTEINLRFVGKFGVIKNINISEDIYSNYIPTSSTNTSFPGSYLSIDLNDVEYVEWTGCIYRPATTNGLNQNTLPYVINDGEVRYDMNDLQLDCNVFYIFSYMANSNSLIIREKNDPTNTFEYNIKNPSIEDLFIFYNMDALISSLKIKLKSSNEVTDFTTEHSNIKYVDGNITSPIIVVDEDELPLDLSSSYRIQTLQNDFKKYVFTNKEREVFEAQSKIILEKLPSSEANSIQVYGVPKNSIVDFDMLYMESDIGRDDLTAFCSNIIPIKDKIDHINSVKGEIFLREISELEYIIVDYEKRNSYCINYNYDVNMYEVSISGDGSVKLIYDAPIAKNGLVETETHKLLKTNSSVLMRPVDKHYIVLKKEGFISEDISI